jgi:DNA-binding transcriptional MerR regulator
MFEQSSPEPIYNTRAVVQRTAVPADTFRAWERRYGVPRPARTDGNQRLYSERDIATIGWLRDQTNAGLTISQAIALFRARTRPAQSPIDPSATLAIISDTGIFLDRHPEASPLGEMRRLLVETLVELDGKAADRIVDEAFALTDVEHFCVDVLEAALSEIGERRGRGAATIASERFAASYVQRKLGALFNQSNPHEGRGPILAACLEGEGHETGLLLTSVFLSRRGFRMLYLGTNMPLPDLCETIERVQPALVVLSATSEDSARKIRDSAPRLRQTSPGNLRANPPLLGFSGRIFRQYPNLCETIDGEYLGANAREAAAAVERICAWLAN